ncbi:2OG-Fe(II) oxygenase [Dyella sp.]|uniref:2OG-Fe(II) oxygenase n=1 Tax=Dyella sp. TaxID=1869338 RepID=UPI002ED1A35C
MNVAQSPLPSHMGTCLIVADFLTAEECAAYIAQAEQRGFLSAELDYPPSYRNNDRQVLDDPALAARLWQRLTTRITLPEDDGWIPQGINERLRLCRYRPGQRFNIHRDGVHHRGEYVRSKLTFMIYLTDGDDFGGGDTLFFTGGPECIGNPGHLVARIRPRRGSLIVFDHDLWHAGEEVTCGSKHILRSDILYRNTAATPAAPGHHGYAWTLLRLADGRIASAGRDATIRLWQPDGEPDALWRGHRQSVLGLAQLSDGRVASISRDRSLRWWNRQGQCLNEVAAHDAAGLCITALPQGRLASGGADHRIHIWSGNGQHLASCQGHQGWIWGLATDGQDRLFSASEDGHAMAWTYDGIALSTLAGDVPLRGIDIRKDAAHTRFAVGDANGWVRCGHIDAQGFTLTRRLRAHAAAIRRVRFLSHGQLATCGEDGALRIWAEDATTLIHEYNQSQFVTDVIESGPSCWIACGYNGQLTWHAGQAIA